MKNRLKTLDCHGHVLLISGASGVGKTTTVNMLGSAYPQVYSTMLIDMNRQLRPGEIGRRVIDTETMHQKQNNGEYLGFSIVNGNVLVGNRISDIEQAFKEGKIVLMDLPFEKVRAVLKVFPHADISIVELVPPSQDELHRRLKNDGRYTGLRVDIGVEKLKCYKQGNFVGLYDCALITETGKQKEIIEKIHQFMSIQCITPAQLANIEKHGASAVSAFLKSKVLPVSAYTEKSGIDKSMITDNML